MNKGFFITMDAAIGLLVVILIISTSITLIESTHQFNALQLERQARDLYDYNYSGGTAPVNWIKTSCNNALNKVSIDSFVYDNTTSPVSIKKITTTVCS